MNVKFIISNRERSFSILRLIPVLLFLFVIVSFKDEDPGEQNIIKIHNAFQSYMEKIQPQAIYLHLDKEVYYVHERIWFKAFLLDKSTLIPDTSCDHLYVELINPYLHRVQAIRIKASGAESSGSFYLGDTVPEGIYQVRAYTSWMKNFGSEYFFSQNIEVRNPMKEYLITPKEARSNKLIVRKLEKKAHSYQIGFFPEGGNLLEGITSLVAFKAENESGKGIEITGTIIDRDKYTIATLLTAHAGMGSFTMKPEKGNVYTALVHYPDGSDEKVVLPEAISNSVGFKLKRSAAWIDIVVQSNKPFSNDRPANEFVFIGQVRDKIWYAAYLNLLDGDTIFRISPDVFPSGIVHFTLFNNRLQPIAERLYFINHADFQGFELTSSRNQDSVHLNIAPTSDLYVDEIFTGSIAVLVTGRNEMADNNSIITELLLTGDLPGIIEQPMYYLKYNDPDVGKNTELLMLTHGWKRFIWQDVLQGKLPTIIFEKEEGITIEGRITREIFEFPIKDAEVRLFILNEYNDEFRTLTNEHGFFRFNRMYYPDTVDVKLLARKPGGGKNLLIQLEEDSYDRVTDRFGNYFLTTSSKLDMKAYRRMQSDIAKEEMRIREKELDSIFRDNIYGTPDYVLWGDEIPSGYTNLLDAMQGRIPGVSIIGNTVTIRGINSIMSSSEPLLLVDGIPTGMETINSIPVQDVERIEILKGPSAAMFGTRGANGVIAVYTKHGMYMKKGEISFSILGYHSVEQFYSPSGQTLNSRIENGQLPATVYWNPNIILRNDNIMNITFPAALPEENLYVIIEGISNQGRIGYGFTSFTQ